MHYYKFALGLQPRRASHFIRIGVVGHKVLETYYRAGLETNSNRGEMYLAAMDELTRFADLAKDGMTWLLLALSPLEFNSM
jgi:hypothetical protein